MKIVKFPNGDYAIRQFSFLNLRWEYLDLSGHDEKGLTKSSYLYWVSRDSCLFPRCLTNNKEKLEMVMSYGDKVD